MPNDPIFSTRFLGILGFAPAPCHIAGIFRSRPGSRHTKLKRGYLCRRVEIGQIRGETPHIVRGGVSTKSPIPCFDVMQKHVWWVIYWGRCFMMRRLVARLEDGVNDVSCVQVHMLVLAPGDEPLVDVRVDLRRQVQQQILCLFVRHITNNSYFLGKRPYY